MNEMLDEMLILTGISRRPLNLERVDLSGIYKELIASLQLQEPKRKIKVTIQPDMVVNADMGAVRLITQNLVQNAWKYTKKTDHASIKMGCSVNDKGETVFFIKDNGLGFDQSIASQIFEPFHRAHINSAIEGMGIGLSIVRRAVERHGGRVWVEAEPNKGACFFFTLEQASESKNP
jgi:signal transduction histidine kinase